MPLEDLPLSKFQDVLNTNVVGSFLCTREAFKLFKSQDPQGGEKKSSGSSYYHVPSELIINLR